MLTGAQSAPAFAKPWITGSRFPADKIGHSENIGVRILAAFDCEGIKPEFKIANCLNVEMNSPAVGIPKAGTELGSIKAISQKIKERSIARKIP
jgi:hypothetical protein